MALLNIDAKEIEESYGVVMNVTNSKIEEAVSQLAGVLVPEKGSNALVDELIGLCKKVQDHYNNEFLPCTKAFLNEFGEIYNIGEYLEKKATNGDVATQSLGYKTSGINADDVIM